MKLLLGTHTSSDTNCECDYAFIDFTSKKAKEVLRKIGLVQELRAKEELVSCVEFLTGVEPGYLEYTDKIEEIQTEENTVADNVWNAEALEVKEDDFNRTECDRLIIYANWNKVVGPTIFWRTVPKHSDVEIETDYIPMELIERIAKGE